MKLAIAGGVFAVGIAAVLSCSINHRSDQYSCAVNGDCENGRVCENGFCVVPGATLDAPRNDAPGPPIDAAASCPGQCTSCNMQQKTCTIDCKLTNCSGKVTCPPGYNCTILCNVENACRSGVSCEQSTACAVECTGRQSCEDVVCGPGPCAVECSGVQSCRNVSCANSCACDVTCTGGQSCSEGIRCTSFACRNNTGRGCTSVPAFCHSCN